MVVSTSISPSPCPCNPPPAAPQATRGKSDGERLGEKEGPAIRNQTDRFSLAIDAIDRIPRFCETGSSVREALLNEQIACMNYAYEFGVDRQAVTDWNWPFGV